MLHCFASLRAPLLGVIFLLAAFTRTACSRHVSVDPCISGHGLYTLAERPCGHAVVRQPRPRRVPLIGQREPRFIHLCLRPLLFLFTRCCIRHLTVPWFFFSIHLSFFFFLSILFLLLILSLPLSCSGATHDASAIL